MDGKITVWERRKVWEDICCGRKVVEDPSQFLNGGTVLSFEEVSYLIVPSLSVIWFSCVSFSSQVITGLVFFCSYTDIQIFFHYPTCALAFDR